jgi:SIR2-like protein
MIGSGFSRNAEARLRSAGPFPLWSGLSSAMLDRLYPEETTPEAERRRRELRYKSTAGAMRLAGEYAALFGREALDDLLARLIPNEGYRPGHLHRLLLSLPWSDVFTTNYDTLLERAAESTHDRRYDVVAVATDIPARERPRIVKLHGSFPHQRPFIITEEDFRTYRERFAPFVNLVQQSAQENVLVLLGFSGEDPNFLSWTGWVRDNLEDNAPTVYLCDLLNLSASERRLLERRKVIPVDLSPLFPAAKWPERDERHRKAVEWFLLNLMSGRPPDPDDWLGRPEEPSQWEPSADLPKTPRPQSFTRLESDSLDPGLSEDQRARKIVEVWRKQREEYPGWVITPREKRERLAEEDEHWIEPVLDAASNANPEEGLYLLYELNWRLERALVRLFGNWVERIVPVLERINPYPSAIEDMDGADVTPARSEHRGQDWSLLAERWVELAFAVARAAREDQDDSAFQRWMGRLGKVVDRQAGWRARWLYEHSQYSLFRGDQQALRARLAEWNEDLGGPWWGLKRAALFAELGEIPEANRLAEGSTHPHQEGWSLFHYAQEPQELPVH